MSSCRRVWPTRAKARGSSARTVRGRAIRERRGGCSSLEAASQRASYPNDIFLGSLVSEHSLYSQCDHSNAALCLLLGHHCCAARRMTYLPRRYSDTYSLAGLCDPCSDPDDTATFIYMDAELDLRVRTSSRSSSMLRQLPHAPCSIPSASWRTEQAHTGATSSWLPVPPASLRGRHVQRFLRRRTRGCGAPHLRGWVGRVRGCSHGPQVPSRLVALRCGSF